MHTRRSAKGPGQGDSAAAQELREEKEDALEGPKETKPSSTADLTGRAEKEVEELKETTSKLEQEVRILRGFAQDTLELLKELREERLGARQSQTVPLLWLPRYRGFREDCAARKWCECRAVRGAVSGRSTLDRTMTVRRSSTVVREKFLSFVYFPNYKIFTFLISFLGACKHEERRD